MNPSKTSGVAAAVVTLALSGAVPTAEGADTVPTKREARAYFVASFPASAPKALLVDQRALVFKARHLRVEKARRCERSEVQVECRFRVRLVPTKDAPAHSWPIRCSGDLWAKKRDGQIVARVGPYKCVSVAPK